MNDNRINKLLTELADAQAKLKQINDEINSSDYDLEDMMGHDDSAGINSKMTKYNVYVDLINDIKKELKGLGYKKA